MLHTDGITEARDAVGRMFGLDRFVDDGVLDDDATVMCCEWRGRDGSVDV